MRQRTLQAVINIKLVSPLTPDECVSRICAAIDNYGLFSWGGSRHVIGRVSRLTVRLRKRIWYRNSFQTFLTGYFERRGNSTVFIGQTGLHPFALLFLVVWFGSLLIIGVSTVVFEQVTNQSRLLGCAGLVLMIGLMVGIVWSGRWLARDEEQFLIAFLAEVIAANPSPDSIPQASAKG